MNKLLKSFLCASLLFVTAGALKAMNGSCCNNGNITNNGNGCCECVCRSIFIPRSVADELEIEAVYKNYRYGEDCFYGDFSATYRYQQSTKGCNIARSLFGSNTIVFQGSSVIPACSATPTTTTTTVGCCGSTTATPTTVLADNFGLSPSTNNTLAFNPRIRNNIVDFELYLGLNEWVDGLFFQINAVLANSKWSLNAFNGAATTTTPAVTGCCNNNNNNGCCNNGFNGNGNNGNCCNNGANCLPLPNGTTSFYPGCMNVLPTTASTAAATFPNLAGVTPNNSFEAALSGVPFGAMIAGTTTYPWQYGKFNFGCASLTKLAAVNMYFGYNFWECTDYHLGIYLRAQAPTGTKGSCCNVIDLFSPIIGQNHWGLGVGLTGHAELYNCDDEHFFNIYWEGYVEHLFKRCQARSFDFTGKGCLSRYMLLKSFTGTALTTTGPQLINAINYATRTIETRVDVAGEANIEFVYSNDCGFSAGLGWNIYGNSSEKGCNIGAACYAPVNSLTLGFKGCSSLQALCVQTSSAGGLTGNVGNAVATAATTFTVTPTNLSTTESTATVNCCPGFAGIDNATTVTTTFAAGAGNSTVCLDACSLSSATAAQIALIAPNAAVVLTGAGATTATIAGTAFNLAIDSRVAGVVTPVTFAGTAVTGLNINSGLAGSQITNKVFGHIDYEWTDCDWTPRAYLGAEGEFASYNRCSGMSAWAVYVGLGVSF